MQFLLKLGIIVPLLVIGSSYLNPQLKDQALDLVMFIRKTVLNVFTKGSHCSSKLPLCLPVDLKLFTEDELSKFKGLDKSSTIYLSYLGTVYDVSKNAKTYGPGGSYSFFSGRDATRAFSTGQFDEAGLKSDVADLSLESYSSVKQWRDFYDKDYPRVGRLVGVYYNENGCETESLKAVWKKLKEHEKEEENDANDYKVFPPCNSEYNGDTKDHRVWCTDQSGGVKRSWVGRPRQLYVPKMKNYRCACVRDNGNPSVPVIEYEDENIVETGEHAPAKATNVGDLNNPRVKPYPNCDLNAVECDLQPNVNKK